MKPGAVLERDAATDDTLRAVVDLAGPHKSPTIRSESRAPTQRLNAARASAETLALWEAHGVIEGVDLLVGDVSIRGGALEVKVRAGKKASANGVGAR